jgi:hypothetical protein
LPIPLILALVALVTLQFKTADDPVLIEEGVAEKEVITGNPGLTDVGVGGVTDVVTVSRAVAPVLPSLLLAVIV